MKKGERVRVHTCTQHHCTWGSEGAAAAQFQTLSSLICQRFTHIPMLASLYIDCVCGGEGGGVCVCDNYRPHQSVVDG